MNGAEFEAGAAAPTRLRRTGVAEALLALVERTMQGMGYELVDLERAGGGLLRVTIDRPARAAGEADAQARIGIEDCERVSRHLTHLFAVEQVDYDRLEVSSPGLDRPLRSARDFARFVGSLVRVQLAAPLNGRRKLRGHLVGIAGEAGQERVRLAPLPDDLVAAAGRAAPRRKTVATKAGAADGAPAPVEFALADVEKARLVPEWELKPAVGRK